MMIFRFGWLLRMRQRVLFPQQAKQVADHRYQVSSFLFRAVFLQGQEFLKVWGFFFVCRIKDFVGWYFQVCNQGVQLFKFGVSPSGFEIKYGA